jgi:ABC-type amino acid transport substrate-binding protein
MTYDVATLKTQAQCLEAKASLESELDGYQTRDAVNAFQDRKSGRADAAATARLAAATDKVAYLTQQLASPGLAPADRRRFEDQLLTANYQKARLTSRTADAGGAAAFLADVDADQIDAQVALLSGAIAAVQARHDALPA